MYNTSPGLYYVDDGSLSNSNAGSDTPLIDSLDVETFQKCPCGRFIALFSFHSKEENDVNVERGEFVTVLNRDDPDWYWVARETGQEGFVPGRFLCPAEGQEAAQLLKMLVHTVDKPFVTGHPASLTMLPGAYTYPPESPTQFPLASPALCSPMSANSSLLLHAARLVVLYDYCARAPDDLTVCRGDWVLANLSPTTQTDPDWLWAFLPGPDRWGYLPRTYARQPTLSQRQPTPMHRTFGMSHQSIMPIVNSQLSSHGKKN